jgi:hypothetical protein
MSTHAHRITHGPHLPHVPGRLIATALAILAVGGIAGYVIDHSVGVNSGSGTSVSAATPALVGSAISQAGLRMGDAIANVAASVPGSKPNPIARTVGDVATSLAIGFPRPGFLPTPRVTAPNPAAGPQGAVLDGVAGLHERLSELLGRP